MIEINQLSVSYGAIKALHEISLSVKAGAIVTLIGGNGAGKTTTLRAISGMVKPKSGQILFEGRLINGLPPHQLVGLGIAHCPEGRMVFANLTVHENLMMGAYLRHDKAGITQDIGFTMPEIARRVVVLPAPFPPMSVTMAPAFTLNEISWSALMAP